MTREELKILFKETILPHQHAPYHFTKVEHPAHEIPAYNPFCGDKYFVQLVGRNRIQQAYFQGIGCAISKASTSLMLQRIEGLSLDETKRFCQQFLDALERDQPLDDPELSVLAALKHFDGRMDCITLPWKALLNYLGKTSWESSGEI